MKYYLTISIFSFLMTGVQCQEVLQISTQDEKLLDSVGHLYLRTNQVPGMGIGVIKNNKVLYSKGLGLKNISTGEPLTNQTVFHMASVSKPFVSTAILQLVEQGKIHLDDLVTDHLSYFRMADERYKKITIEHLLLHTGGVPDVGDSENYEWDNPQVDDEALERYVKSLSEWELDFKPGRKKPAYTNTGYEILGDIISKASGMTFETFMQDHVFAPNQMNHSSFLLSDIPEDMLSSAHMMNADGKVEVSPVYPYNRKHAPSSCLLSNVEDMLRFAITNLRKGKYMDTTIFSETTYNLLMTPKVRENKIFQYGMGWNVANYRDTQRLEFTGGDIGFDTVIIMVPSASFAIVIMSNRYLLTPAFQVINTAFDIADRYN